MGRKLFNRSCFGFVVRTICRDILNWSCLPYLKGLTHVPSWSTLWQWYSGYRTNCNLNCRGSHRWICHQTYTNHFVGYFDSTGNAVSSYTGFNTYALCTTYAFLANALYVLTRIGYYVEHSLPRTHDSWKTKVYVLTWACCQSACFIVEINIL